MQSVDIAIRAKDQASRTFGIVGTSATILGKTLRSVGHIAGTTLTTAFRMAERAAMGLGAGLVFSTYNAIKQQAAEIELASALKVTNQYTEETLKILKEQASNIQNATVYGDEYIEMLMRMAITQGVAADKAGEVAKGAIALYEGFGGGRGKPEIFLRYYIDALRGTGSSLDSYVGELRNANTQEEKMKILQGALARGWDVAKSKTDSAGGALRQAKNALYDVSETIAEPLLPMITSSAHAIKMWAIENQDNIGWWAKKSYSYVVFVKDVFWEFVKFMRDDWRTGISFVFNSFIELLKATFESAVIIAIAGGKGIWKGVKEGILGGEKEQAIYQRTKQLYKEYEKNAPPGTLLPGLGPPLHHTAIYYKLREQAEKEIVREGAKSIIGESINAVTDSFKDAFALILKDMPEDLREKVDEAWKRNLARLEALGAAPGKRPYAGAEPGAPAPFSLASLFEKLTKTKREPGLAGAEEARLLTTAGAGSRFVEISKSSGETAKNTNTTAKNTAILIKEVKKMASAISLSLGGTGTAYLTTDWK